MTIIFLPAYIWDNTFDKTTVILPAYICDKTNLTNFIDNTNLDTLCDETYLYTLFDKTNLDTLCDKTNLDCFIKKRDFISFIKKTHLDCFNENCSIVDELVPTELRPDLFQVVESGSDVTRWRRVTQIRMRNAKTSWR